MEGGKNAFRLGGISLFVIYVLLMVIVIYMYVQINQLNQSTSEMIDFMSTQLNDYARLSQENGNASALQNILAQSTIKQEEYNSLNSQENFMLKGLFGFTSLAIALFVTNGFAWLGLRNKQQTIKKDYESLQDKYESLQEQYNGLLEQDAKKDEKLKAYQIQVRRQQEIYEASKPLPSQTNAAPGLTQKDKEKTKPQPPPSEPAKEQDTTKKAILRELQHLVEAYHHHYTGKRFIPLPLVVRYLVDRGYFTSDENAQQQINRMAYRYADVISIERTRGKREPQIAIYPEKIGEELHE